MNIEKQISKELRLNIKKYKKILKTAKKLDTRLLKLREKRPTILKK